MSTAPPAVSSGRTLLNFDVVDFSSTYSALSSCLAQLREAGVIDLQGSINSAEYETVMIAELEEHEVDLSDIRDFPYDAKDLDDVIQLLLRLQTRLSGPKRGNEEKYCTMQELITKTLVDRGGDKIKHRYELGELVEVLSPCTMKYNLDRINDIIRVYDEGDSQFIYVTTLHDNVQEGQIRLPRQALQAVFGMGPWVWRQWAAVRLEAKLLFREGDRDDFEILNIPAYANELWKLWLADAENASFKELYERVGTSGQEELVKHITSPFTLMHSIVTNDNNQWDLESAELSVYTYCSVLGSRFPEAFLTLLIQVTMPVSLFMFYKDSLTPDDNKIFDKPWIEVGTLPMLWVVLLYYLFKISLG